MKVTTLSSSNGLINISAPDSSEVQFPSGPWFRRAILCITGEWQGQNGPVDVTLEMLQGVADRYNKEKEKVLSVNDYAPLLVDHDRKADNVKGRIDVSVTKLFVGPHPIRDDAFCLFGDIRIDDDDAKYKVAKGKYAALSMSFDDESFELFEESFVAVEAARGSQILSKGDKKMSKKFKVVALGLVNSVITSNREINLGIVNGVKSTSEGVIALKASVAQLDTAIKTATIKNLFHGFIREGKMNKAELGKLNLKELAGMSPSALKIVTDSYSNRKPSTDIQQFGVQGQKPVHGDITKTEFRKLRDQQLALGKGKSKNLAAEDDKDDKKEDDDKEDKKAKDLSAEEDKTSEGLASEDSDGLHKLLTDCMEKIKTLSEGLDSIQSYAKKLQVEDKKEEELASGDDDSKEDDKKDSKDLSAEDDKDADKDKDEK